MLEAVKLSKTYKPKKGVPVKALDNINLRFPERGMVFLLGKSGSGKSTLLNLLGGLDRYDKGGSEIIIKGVSSKNFSQQHFDSYRNTYVGFIFQEYNILEEFTVGANIGLALELQGIKASSDRINEILHEVDLDGYGSRRPNELSGGQKQRVAIARALVKKPEIIMADEPTGALDSNTGKQIFDTLKKLSRDKLVIIVSHDREFSERYADRIIELSDGRVISDVEYDESISRDFRENKPVYNGSTVELPEGYELTEEDRLAINAYIKSHKEGKLSLKLSESSNKRFKDTDQSLIKLSDSSKFKLIKSKLPLKPAFKIGASSLKHKKIRLVFTVFLSLVAFTLFGIADTFASYDHIDACTSSLVDSGITYASFSKSIKETDGDVSWYRSGYKLNDDDLKEIYERTGVKGKGVLVPGNVLDLRGSFDSSKITDEIHGTALRGFAESSQAELEGMGYELVAGSYPRDNIPYDEIQEIAVTTYLFETYRLAGYCEAGEETDKAVYEAVEDYDDLIGKTLFIDGQTYKITGIFDCDFNWDRYRLLTEPTETMEPSEMLKRYILSNEFTYEYQYGLIAVGFTGKGFINEYDAHQIHVAEMASGMDISNSDSGDDWIFESYLRYLMPFYEIDVEKISWIGEKRDSLADNEIILPAHTVNLHNSDYSVWHEGMTASELAEIFDGNNSLILYNYRSQEQISLKIVGFYDDPSSDYDYYYYEYMIASDKLISDLAKSSDGYYSHAVGVMPESRADVKKMVSSCYDKEQDILYTLVNPVTFELDSVNEILKDLAEVFLYIGIAFAVFAALMLSNFISTSIAYKKQEIGILRAIGSRSNDVFRIFFAESFIIAMINFVLSVTSVGIITVVINSVLRKEIGILITVLSFSIRQVLLLLVISIGVAFIASFLPVKKIASKRPIDAIRNR